MQKSVLYGGMKQKEIHRQIYVNENLLVCQNWKTAQTIKMINGIVSAFWSGETINNATILARFMRWRVKWKMGI
jgi:hypothetical protein